MSRFSALPQRLAVAVARWFDADAADPTTEADDDQQIDWPRVIPYVAIHLACLGVLWVGVSTTAVAVAVALYALRMFAVTAFYHRYFSHRSFKTSRAWQFVFACLGSTSVQRGPLWWASHHRNHHRFTDTAGDAHSPRLRGFWWSHLGWFLCKANFRTRMDRVPDLARFPELRFLDRFDVLVPLVLALTLFAGGELLESRAPGLGTDGWQLLVWGFFISTVALHHVTFLVNSAAHLWGRRVFATGDDSRNNWWIALLTFGEGWHNNHHRFPATVRQGLRWWELDLSWYLLWFMERIGIVSELHPAPQREVIERARLGEAGP